MSAPSTFPDDFEATVPMRIWARARGMHPRSRWLEDQTARFVTYHFDGPETSVDWTVEWAVWMLRAWSTHAHSFDPRGYCSCCTRNTGEEAAR